MWWIGHRPNAANPKNSRWIKTRNFAIDSEANFAARFARFKTSFATGPN
tara:strand:+ start:61058 stop:61204 length:147 start_codon:yes stop_codon:yes gene_type:complete